MNRTISPNPLATLGAHLSARRLEVELTAHGLRVTNPGGVGCCDEVPGASDLITCRKRADDGGREWFYSSWNEPIAEADQIMNAVTEILGRLTPGQERQSQKRRPDDRDRGHRRAGAPVPRDVGVVGPAHRKLVGVDTRPERT